MRENINRLINAIKQQAEGFLLEAKEFYPFGTYINKKNEIVPVGVYLGNDYSPSLEIIDLLEKNFKDNIKKGECKIAAIAIDVVIKEKDVNHDAIELRFFVDGRESYKKYLKYEIKQKQVVFSDNK